MANYCYTRCYIEDYTEEGAEKLLKFIDMDIIQCPDEYLFDVNFDLDVNGSYTLLSFTTKWGVYQSTIEFLLGMLGTQNAECLYEEGGMQIGGRFICEENTVTEEDVLDAYWDDQSNEKLPEYVVIDMEDYFSNNKVLSTRVAYLAYIIQDVETNHSVELPVFDNLIQISHAILKSNLI